MIARNHPSPRHIFRQNNANMIPFLQGLLRALKTLIKLLGYPSELDTPNLTKAQKGCDLPQMTQQVLEELRLEPMKRGF